MCGICGFVGQGNLDDLMHMNSVLIHRGPDATGAWYDRERAVYLGHRRLSILDVKDGGQPMWTRDGMIGIVFNGEIYNHLHLREALMKTGHTFETDHSDTEVLLHGYREWGTNLPHKLNGMWAFAIYDKKNNNIFISRDRFGKKPLFYSLQDGIFAFASELSSLTRHKKIDKTISQKSLQKYFAYGYIPAPSTLFKDIFKLPGGHNLILKLPNLELRLQKYWEFIIDPFEKIPRNPEEEWGEEIRRLLYEAIKRRLISDVPLGIFLSGGIDSSSIAAFAVKAGAGEKIKSFSIGFEEESYDETFYSKQIASLLGTEHLLTVLSIEEAKILIPEIANMLDEPMGDSSIVPTFLLCREARKHVTVALGGDGADELFAGYDPFRALRLAELFSRLIPKPLHTAIRILSSWLPTVHHDMSLDFKIKRTLRGLSYSKKLWLPVWLGPLEPSELCELFTEPFDIDEIYEEAITTWDRCKQENIVDKTQQFYINLYLQNDILVKVDRASMMNSLEVRCPYLDIDLVNFVRRIPHIYKFRKGQNKYILKMALKNVLPSNVLYRRKKGFGIPRGKWFREGSLTLPSEGIFASKKFHMNPSFITKKISEHKRNRQDNKSFLWNQLILSRYEIQT
jgi:asparagine synthase (glutamine-hydrolysing)